MHGAMGGGTNGAGHVMRAPQSAKSAPRLSVSPLDAARLSEPPEDAAPAPSTEVSTLSSS